MDNYNYPEGTDTPNAPWNEEEFPERTFCVETIQTLTAKGYVKTSKYTNIEYTQDEDGVTEEIDTSDVDWADVWSDEYYTVSELLDMFVDRLVKDAANAPSKEEEKKCINLINNIRLYTKAPTECEYFEAD